MTHPSQAPRHNQYPQPEWSRGSQTPPIVYNAPLNYGGPDPYARPTAGQPQYGYDYAPQQPVYAPQPHVANQLSQYALAPQPGWTPPAANRAPNGEPSLFDKAVKKLKEHKIGVIGASTGVAASLVATAMLNMSHDKKTPDSIALNADGSVTSSQGGHVIEGPIASDGTAIDKDGDGISKADLMALSNPADAKLVAPADLISVFGSDFDNWRQDEYKLLQKIMTPDQSAVFDNGNYPSGEKDSWTDQQVLNAIALDIADATAQDTPTAGELMLPTILDAHSSDYQTVYNQAGPDTMHDSVLGVYNANGNPYPKLGSEFMGFSDLTPNARLIYGSYIHDGKGDDNMTTPVVVFLVDLVKGSDGQSSQWRKLNAWNINDEDFQAAAPKVG